MKEERGPQCEGMGRQTNDAIGSEVPLAACLPVFVQDALRLGHWRTSRQWHPSHQFHPWRPRESPKQRVMSLASGTQSEPRAQASGSEGRQSSTNTPRWRLGLGLDFPMVSRSLVRGSGEMV